MDEVKKQFESNILDSLKKGLKPIDISKQLNISLSNLSYYLTKLKNKNLIKKVGLVYEVNEIELVKRLTKATNFNLGIDSIRGHAFIWKVRINKYRNINWKLYLDNKQINYDEVGRMNTPRIFVMKRKIWLGKKHIIVYFNEEDSFYGENAIESRKFAVVSLLETLDQFSIDLKLDKLKGSDFEFTPTREHFPMIKNVLAVQLNRKREKLYVYNNKGNWLCIDDSYNLGELEILGSPENKPMETSLNVQRWWNKGKENGFKFDDKVIENNFKEFEDRIKNLSEQNIKLTQVIEQMSNNMIKLTAEVYKK